MPHTTPPPQPAGDPCPGRCNAPWRNAEHRYAETGREHDLQPRDGNPIWCPPCTTAIRGALADMPELTVRLQLEADSGTSAALREHVSGSKERALHEHQTAVFLIEEIAGWLGDWEDTIRADRELDAPRVLGIGHPRTIANAAGFLPRHLTWLLTKHPGNPDAATGFGLELLLLHRRAQTVVHAEDAEPVRCAGVACPDCDHKALEHEVDRDTGVVTGYIRCRKCRPVLRMTPQEYERWTRMLAADAHARGLAPREKLAEIFGSSVPAQYARAAA